MGNRPPYAKGLVVDVVNDDGTPIERNVIKPMDESAETPELHRRREKPTQPLRPARADVDPRSL